MPADPAGLTDLTELRRLDRLVIQIGTRLEGLVEDIGEFKTTLDRVDQNQQEVRTERAAQAARAEMDMRRLEALEQSVRDLKDAVVGLQASIDTSSRKSTRSSLATMGGAAVGGGTIVGLIQQLLEILGTGQ